MAAEQVTEHVAQGLEETAYRLEEAARATRMIDVKNVGFLLGGLGVGVAIGFYFGYRFNKEKIRAEEFRRSEEEIAKLREIYVARDVAREAQREKEKVAYGHTTMPKPSVGDVVRERGYSETPTIEDHPRPTRPPVPVTETLRNYREQQDASAKDKNVGWSYPLELSKRSPNRPYIIHQDEFMTEESGHQQVVYTYYAGDNVLTDEDGTILNNRENLIGENTLRFGHGSDDADVVYIRNPTLELEFEICRIPLSFEEEAMGISNEQQD